MSETKMTEKTWSMEELPDDSCPLCGEASCDSILMRDQVQMPCGTWHWTKRYRFKVGKVCSLTAQLALYQAVAEAARKVRKKISENVTWMSHDDGRCTHAVTVASIESEVYGLDAALAALPGGESNG